MQTVQAAHPDASVELWAQDEHRLGLKPVLRRVWSLPGKRPLARVWPRYQWCYVVACVQPATGQTFWLLVPRIATDVYSQVLAEFAAALGVGPDKQIVLVVDRAGWHRRRKLVVPDGLQLECLPAYSPALQPAERLWGVVDEPLANQVVPTLTALLDVLTTRCQALREPTAAIAGRTNFHWWPQAVSWSGK